MAAPPLNSTPDAPPHFRLMDLPAELHLHISSFLSYPDALALKHTSRNFYSFVYTGVHLKVDWLVERFERKLECPMEKCSFRTDEAFCNWRIQRIMERRRRHLECPRARGGCLVIEGRTCQMDLVPTWLKRQGRVKLLKAAGNEVLIHGLMVLFMQVLLVICQRFVSPPLILNKQLTRTDMFSRRID
ncbi:hypothetical protein ASPVEDRAFT_48993 [Aspergillus versicolor CBS 583.65]|uniref:F-box domain-containing protein n=1 Tax=Aspergillus versicolor CBS 583.65 TaxID=1036611 RepID=A0A1L9P5Z0_ASPVE|nr:uncharacterized protein ASPVEDRAFT_48993 [Aspergillus versicolor CBS 583.65]OJI96902.1 hypothetical protein ASPVEDRAFT_48993 [Aspergillus versicolor CBS 583.65]